MRTYDSRKKKSPTIPVVQTEALKSLQGHPQPFQEKSNEEGLAEHAERFRKFQRLGNSFIQMGPPRLDHNTASSLKLKPWIQPKLTIGEPGDKYEQEADRVASQVVQTINAPTSEENNIRQSIQRVKDLEGVMYAKGFQAAIQRKQAIADGEASQDLESAINRARGSGQPLDAGLQQSMGQAMGADFSGVRIHTDAQSDQLNRSIQARAFTTGQDVFFQSGAYQPGNRGGQELIAHELTHVVQQSHSLQRMAQTRSLTQISTPSLNQSRKLQTEHSEVSEVSTLIVEDTAINMSPHQMKKSDFLKQLYIALYDVGTEEYQGTNLTVEGCPYISYWFDRYRRKDHTHIENALRKYTSAPPSIETIDELIKLICVRARRGFRNQVTTGDISELPDDVPQQVEDKGDPETNLIVQEKLDDGGKSLQRKQTINVDELPLVIEGTREVSVQRGCLKGSNSTTNAVQSNVHVLQQRPLRMDHEDLPPDKDVMATGYMGGCASVIVIWNGNVRGKHGGGGSQAIDFDKLLNGVPDATGTQIIYLSTNDLNGTGLSLDKFNDEVQRLCPNATINRHTTDTNYQVTRNGVVSVSTLNGPPAILA